MKKTYTFLVLGHPRTGTGYMSKLFGYFGYDVGHEVFGKDGISNWMYSFNNIHEMPVWGTKVKRDDCEFKNVLMVVRNPYSAVRSFINTENVLVDSNLESFSFSRFLEGAYGFFRHPLVFFGSLFEKKIPIRASLDYRLKYLDVDISSLNEVEVAVYIYAEWLRQIRLQYPNITVIKLEKAKSELSSFLICNGFELKIKMKSEPSKNYNTRNKKDAYKEVDFAMLSPKFRIMLKSLCDEYGYEYEYEYFT